jgi:hypothetical protein
VNEDSPSQPRIGERRYDAYVSAVTSECGKARDAVAAELRKLDFHVAVQSDFEQRPVSVTTLQKLHDYISACDQVHCIVGTRSGAFPPADAAAPFAGLLPAAITEASYTQWEYFFASHYAPDRLWLYRVTDAWQPDEAVPSEPDRPEAQRAFLGYLNGAGQDFAPVGSIDGVRAAVLAPHARHRDADGPRDGRHEPFHRALAANTFGGIISGIIVALLLGSAAQLGGAANPAIALLMLLASAIGGIAFCVIFLRYGDILTWRGRHERLAYDRLRRQLARGGLAAETYARRLTAALDAVDRFFGDAGMASRTLFPRAFGLRTPAPLWTAPAFDRCLLLALLYPVVTILVVWAVSGHAGPAELALHLESGVPGPRRAITPAEIGAMLYCFWRFNHATHRTSIVWIICLFAVISVTILAATFSGAGLIAFFAGILGGFALGVPAIRGYFVARTDTHTDTYRGAIVGTGTVAFAVALAGSYPDTHGVADNLASAFASACTVASAFVVTILNVRANRDHWRGTFQVTLVATLIILCFVSARTLGHAPAWVLAGPLLLFLGLLALLNAPFDWISLGLTRALLRRGLELGGWFPYLLALADALAAAALIALLTIVTVLGVQMFDDLAAFSGGNKAVILPLDTLFNGIQANPAAPEFWWVYAMLLSTMIPSLVNLTIAGGSFLRGIPWITTLLLRNMPDDSAPPGFERLWITLLLTTQLFAGGLLGIAAQGFLAYVVIGLALPLFGFDLLELARGVAAADLPGALMRLAGMVRH